MHQLLRKFICSIVCLVLSVVSIGAYGLGSLLFSSVTLINSLDEHTFLISAGSAFIAIAAIIQLILYKRCDVVLVFINAKLVWLFFVLPFSLSLIVAIWSVTNISYEFDEGRYSSGSNSSSYDLFD